jgi:NADH-quinone oxidoreductase subunit H
VDTVRTAGILDFKSIYDFFDGFLPESLDWLAYAFAGGVLALMVITTMVLATAVNTWVERRGIGRVQNRLGPNRWGPFGLFQPLADFVKLLTKEDLAPEGTDKPVFSVAPLVLLVPAFLVVSVIPFGPDSFLGRLNIGALFVIGVTSAGAVGIFMGGWSSRNKYAMLGAVRGVAMLISYEVPMALAITGVLLVSGSLSMFDIVQAQRIPFLLVQPLGFLVFVAAASAEMSRTPFDQIEAESELGSGYATEYSGMKFAIWQMAEFMAPVVTGILVATLFLGGTRGWDPVPGQVWFVIKVVAVVLMMLWFRATWPRLRIDQIMGFAWKGLFVLGLVNLFLLAVEIELLQDAGTGILSTDSLWLMAAINWVVSIATVVVLANVLGQREIRPPEPVPSPLADMNAEAD